MNLFTWCFILWVAYKIYKALNDKLQSHERAQYSANARRQMIEGVAGMLSKMAKADGHVNKDEVDVAEEFLKSLQLTPSEMSLAKRTFNRAMDDHHGVEYYAELFSSVVSTEGCRLVYEMLWGVAAADEFLDPAEERLLHRAALALGFDDSMFFYYRRIHAGDFRSGHSSRDGYGGSRQGHRESGGYGSGYGSYRQPPRTESELEKAYSKLGCSASDSDDQVRAAYRKQAMRYHPDRLRAEGLPEGMLAQANKSMAEINAAWDLIRESRKLH